MHAQLVVTQNGLNSSRSHAGWHMKVDVCFLATMQLQNVQNVQNVRNLQNLQNVQRKLNGAWLCGLPSSCIHLYNLLVHVHLIGLLTLE